MLRTRDREADDLRRQAETAASEASAARRREEAMATQLLSLDIFKLDLIARELKEVESGLSAMGKAAAAAGAGTGRLVEPGAGSAASTADLVPHLRAEMASLRDQVHSAPPPRPGPLCPHLTCRLKAWNLSATALYPPPPELTP